MSKPVIYTTTWCKPCKVLKSWVAQHGYSVEFKDADTEKPRVKLGQSIDIYPTLQFGDELISGVLPIQKWLEEN